MNVVTFLTNLVCFIGCSYQVYDIISLFLRYDTVTFVSIKQLDSMKMMDLSLCARARDVFDLAAFSKAKRAKVWIQGNEIRIDGRKKRATIKDYFDFTPDGKDLIDECAVRQPLSYSHDGMDRVGCNKMFQIEKFFIQEYICYKFHVKTYENDTYYFDHLAFARSFSGMFFAIFLKPQFYTKIFIFKASIHSNAQFPELSIVSTETIFQTENGSHYNPASYNLDFFKYFIFNLPAPFKTDCLNYHSIGYKSQRDCFVKCLQKQTIKHFNKVSFVGISQSIDYETINDTDNNNRTFAKFLHQLEVACDRNCSKRNCILDRYITETHIYQFKRNTRFKVEIPKQPSFKVRYSQKLDRTEFLVYMFSCFGTWFGLSMSGILESLLKWKGNTDVIEIKRSSENKRRLFRVRN